MPALYPRWINVVLYQSAWFVAVLGRESLVVLALALVGLHLLLVARGARAATAAGEPATGAMRRELATLGAVTAIGVAADSALTVAGVYAFTPAASVLPIPLWLVAIWLAFATTLRHALAPIVARAPLAVVGGALSAPLSYLAAARLGAVELPHGALATGLGLGLVWALLMGAFVALVRRIESGAWPPDRRPLD